MSAIEILIGVVGVSLTLAGSFWAGFKAGTIGTSHELNYLRDRQATLLKYWREQRDQTLNLNDEILQLRVHIAHAHKQLRDRVRPKLP